jgi:hypothetical protein
VYNWICLNSSADLRNLKDHITSEYAPDIVALKLEVGISDAVKGLLIEHNYVDKDYRSVYYNFYSKKGQYYRSDCVRLHFFDQTVTFDEDALTLTCSDEYLTHHYFGFMVLRPTGIGTIGRSVLSPDVRTGADRYIITADHKVHLLGYELLIQGFPSMDQHEDISVCAHAACWSILRHYSESFSNYRERLLHDITVMASPFDPGGLLPSQGLALFNAERIFQQAKAFPVIIARELNNPGDLSFYRQLTAYIDSRFPVFAADHTKGHAIAIVGYDWRTPLGTGVQGMRYSWDEIKSFAVIDDNYLPYLSVPVSGGTWYSVKDIDAFIVALPEKMFYPAEAIDKIAPTLFKIGGALGLPAAEESVIRYFLTTGSELRHFVRSRESEYDPTLFKAIMMLPYAQFVWIVEIATEQQWAINQVSGRAIIDATASLAEFNPLWLLHGPEGALFFERKTVNPDAGTGGGVALSYLAGVPTSFSRIDQNLRPTQTK